jgi:hypothetical protein
MMMYAARGTGKGPPRTSKILHDQEGRPVVGGADVHHGRDVFVLQAAGCLGLTLKTSHDLAVAGQKRVQEFDGETATDGRVLCLVDLAHAARAEQAHQPVFSTRGLAHARVDCAVALGHRASPGAGVFRHVVAVWSIPEAIGPH